MMRELKRRCFLSSASRLAVLMGLFGCFIMPLQVMAEQPRIDVIGGTFAHHKAVFDAMHQTLEHDSKGSFILDYHLVDQYRPVHDTPPILRVAVGTEAARLLSQTADTVPQFYILLLPEQYWALSFAAQTQRSALFLGQPAARYLALVQQAMPQRKSVGVILGPISSKRQAELQQEAKRLQLDLHSATIRAVDELPAALNQLAKLSDVLLTLPDPVVVNPETARTLILTSYQQGISLVGYSRALVKAGALMAVHTTPEQFGRELAGIVQAIGQGDHARLPEPDYSAYFVVSVNYQLARALDLSISPENQLLEQLQLQEMRHETR